MKKVYLFPLYWLVNKTCWYLDQMWAYRLQAKLETRIFGND